MAHWQGTFPAVPAAIGILRGEMAAIARECGLSDEGVADVKIAVSEAATNVVVHAYPDGEGHVSAAAIIDAGTLRIVIRDTGRGMGPRIDSPGLGLGMPVIAIVAQSVDVRSNGEGTEVHMTFPCPAAA